MQAGFGKQANRIQRNSKSRFPSHLRKLQKVCPGIQKSTIPGHTSIEFFLDKSNNAYRLFHKLCLRFYKTAPDGNKPLPVQTLDCENDKTQGKTVRTLRGRNQ